MSSYYSRCIISLSSGRGSFNGKGHGKTFPERTGIAMSNPHPAWEGKRSPTSHGRARIRVPLKFLKCCKVKTDSHPKYDSSLNY